MKVFVVLTEEIRKTIAELGVRKYNTHFVIEHVKEIAARAWVYALIDRIRIESRLVKEQIRPKSSSELDLVQYALAYSKRYSAWEDVEAVFG